MGRGTMKAAVLDGTEVVNGLAVDTDLRWALIASLAAKGAVDEAVIAAEMERDPTDQGRRRGASARAALPRPEGKAAAWEAVLGDARMPLATKRAVVGGFGQYGQEEILGAFGPRYLEALPLIWNGRTPEESLLLTEALYPSTVVSEETLAVADQALARDDVPEPGKRLILEARDSTRRALRARAVDASA